MSPAGVDVACPPRWATARTPERATLGGAAARIARALGFELMDWQRQVVDVALELDGAGRLVYRDVTLCVPRQSGKSTLLLVVILTRALWRGRQQIRYTAQTANDARKKVFDEWRPVLQQSPFGALFDTVLANGREALNFNNGSVLSLVASTHKAGHGSTIDLAIVDEAFSYQDARLEQSLRPAMVTRASAQFWTVSTAGTKLLSPFFLSKVERGRELVGAGVASGSAFFEWSAQEDADPSDPATWRQAMPALGSTIDEATIAADFTAMDISEFRRAYLNQWTAATGDPVISAEAWAALADPTSTALDPVALAVDVSPDRSVGTIAAAGRTRKGRVHVEVIASDRGTGWIAGRIKELVSAHRPIGVVVDAAGPAASLVPELGRLHVRGVMLTSGRDCASAAGTFYDLVVDGKLRHIGQPDLAAAVTSARKRPLSDAWAWSRSSSSADITAVVACSLAAWALVTKHRPSYIAPDPFRVAEPRQDRAALRREVERLLEAADASEVTI